MKKIILISTLLLFLAFPVLAEASSFCDDPDTWEHFESMTKKYPDDVPLQIIHALKIGLCVKIKQNSITETEAINLFNEMIDTLANMREEKNEREDL
ncbi:MAG: hypothetical protein KKE44_20715 [Proteobacteria bacterium]|nr:hypothetical protein [Pseudomonadota bacterium]MBU1585154.1 hypothetical protein [Pseudomonadota bacterium]MBU2454467.1 hypothetical protein [Pseudomonadota bacterium]MBU2629280.1 hypothetical protein [Pseudomonadota bacterium]